MREEDTLVFSRLWLILFLFGSIPILLSGWASFWYLPAMLWYFSLICLAIADWFLLPKKEALRIEREVEEKLGLGVENAVTLRVRNSSSRKIALQLRESPPEGIKTDLAEAPLAFSVLAKGRHIAVYHLTPNRRGSYAFGNVFLRVYGMLGMVQRTLKYPLVRQVKVYPSLNESAKFNLMARKGRLQQVGIRAARVQGAGREFESLRDYMPDDEMRRIDWKATARRGKLVARQYEVERSQTVIIAIDVGRTMLADIDGIQKLDYAIQAALMLAYVATLSEDQVGLLVFAEGVETYLPPRKGRAQVYAMMEALYDVKASLAETDYRTAFSYLKARWKKRALVVCFADLWDPDSSRTTVNELALLQPRHLVAAVTLLDSMIVAAAEQSITTADSAYQKGVATQALEERTRALAVLSQRGVLVVDTPADKLSAELVNQYLRVKERLML